MHYWRVEIRAFFGIYHWEDPAYVPGDEKMWCFVEQISTRDFESDQLISPVIHTLFPQPLFIILPILNLIINDKAPGRFILHPANRH